MLLHLYNISQFLYVYVQNSVIYKQVQKSFYLSELF